jgi:GntR family transcriptional regulator, transcriptional repressor for pyruvate dehydrogenase complex
MAQRRGCQAMSVPGAAPRFTSLARSPNLSEAVAEALTDTILSTPLHAGDPLPSERQLCEQFGVSRPVVREAVRSLAAKGLILVRVGRGLEVGKVASGLVAESMTLYLRGSETVGYDKVSEVRSALEIEIAGVAAARTTPVQIEEIRTIAAALGKAEHAEQAAHADVEFHRAIAAATGNELFLVMLDSIGETLLDVRRRGFRTDEAIRYAAGAHDEILERVAAADVSGARRAMRLHLEESARRLLPR